MSGQYIAMQNPKISGDNRISVELSCSKGVRKFLLSDRLHVEYDMPISGVNPSILQIPAVSGVITVAWAVGADVYVEELDKMYLEYIRRWQSVVKAKRWYSTLSGTGALHARSVVSNNYVSGGKGLLFTRGVDSIASYIRHRHEKPILIHVLWPGADEKTWKKVPSRVTEFAANEKVPLHIIRTNIPRAMNNGLLYARFGLEWWQQVNHSIVLTGLCAPLTYTANIETLYMASGGTPVGRKYPDPMSPVRLAKMSWGGTQVAYDGDEISRQLKIRCFLRDYVKRNGGIFLKVCNNLPESNCGNCEKCFRTITGLVLEGIDPNKCGFSNVNGNTFHRIKEEFEKKRFFQKKWIIESDGDFLMRFVDVSFWQDMQKHMPKTIKDIPIDSENSLEWFRSFDIPDYLRKTENNIDIFLIRFLKTTLRYLLSIWLYELTSSAVRCFENLRLRRVMGTEAWLKLRAMTR